MELSVLLIKVCTVVFSIVVSIAVKKVLGRLKEM